MRKDINLTMLTDFYEFTMGNGYLKTGMGDKIAYFDIFFREVPDGGGFAIMAGLEQAVEYIKNLHFDEEDLEFFRKQNLFCDEFLDYLKNFKFTCDVWSVPEGTPIFPKEPVMIIRGPVIQAQFLETMLLICVNHQSLIATKANKIVRSANGRPVMEFGARRAQGCNAALQGARATYIAGCSSTSCTVAAQKWGIPASGTMAHSWVQLYDNEYEAFKNYAELYPENCILLIDTYNVLKSGIKNAIKVFDEVLKPKGYRPVGVRIDSGDITYLSKKIRKILDDAGYPDCKIVASNSLDEIIIRETTLQGAKIDSFGVGERMITSKSEPVFGGVYKLVAVENDGQIIPKIKISENVAKITNPHFKKVYRIYENSTNKAMADLVCLYDEEIDQTKPLEIFNPDYTWKRKVIEDYTLKPLLVKIFDKGELVYELPDVHTIRDYCLSEVDKLWDEVKRFENPHTYYVDLSQKLWDIRHEMLERENSKK
ncbi:MAG: nicotinate phosphoribosyltransferase [Ruminococcaceae bacterium]|nr:nicotinate phosphoribosyltransferase [Oscillospiraceae bacterium]